MAPGRKVSNVPGGLPQLAVGARPAGDAKLLKSSLWNNSRSVLFFYRRIICLIILNTISLNANAGEIAGMHSQLVPTTNPDFSLNFSNDFLGRGGSVDDFRTAQIIISANLGERWFALLDHSTLTLEEAQINGRVDQLTGSLGYRFIDRQSTSAVSRLAAGTGFRSAGDFSGEPMQNGFHRIVGSEISSLPYVESSGTDLTLWVDADHYNEFHTSSGDGFFGGWRSGYWIRASSLVTSDRQLDSALGAYAVTSRNSIDIWMGFRRDWRSGYDQDFVQAATAAAEDDIAFVIGLRWGALVLETVQQLNNEASYGQLKLVADASQSKSAFDAVPRASFEFGFLLPDVQVQLAGKIRSTLFATTESAWRESIVIDTRFGEPQYEDNSELYVETRQVTIGMEWERPLAGTLNWISAYGAAGVGWRSEKLLGDGLLAGEESEAIGKATAIVGGGLRFAAANLGRGWRYRLQLGVSSWIPSSTAEVLFAGQPTEIHKTGFGINLGMTFDYE